LNQVKNNIMAIEKFAQLPPELSYQGVNFQLKLIVSGSPGDVRLVYAISYADDDSPHCQEVRDFGCWVNVLDGGKPQGFLYLVENISTDAQLRKACRDCTEWLNRVFFPMKAAIEEIEALGVVKSAINKFIDGQQK
jgi:hypothetical protein